IGPPRVRVITASGPVPVGRRRRQQEQLGAVAQPGQELPIRHGGHDREEGAQYHMEGFRVEQLFPRGNDGAEVVPFADGGSLGGGHASSGQWRVAGGASAWSRPGGRTRSHSACIAANLPGSVSTLLTASTTDASSASTRSSRINCWPSTCILC